MNTKLTYCITSPADHHLKGLQQLWAEAFEDTPYFIQLFFDTAFSPNRCLITLLEDEVVGTLYWFDCEYQGLKLAYLYGVSTAKKHRGMGICHKLIDHCHQQLSASGYTGVLLVPGSTDLYSFYGRLGYETCSYIREFDCMAEKGDAYLHLITKEEYAILRRKFLPEHAVIQEGENLNFLETYVQFYVGCNVSNLSQQIPDFILAAYREDTTLHGVELLGNSAVTPHIVHELGCGKGIFRTPGNDFPFAMYHSLGNEPIDFPVYFGLAFD